MKLPMGWSIKSLDEMIQSLDAGVSVNSKDNPVSNSSETGILKTSCVTTGVFKNSENKSVIESECNRVCVPVKSDRIILSRMNTPALVGANAYVPSDHPNLFLPDRLWQLEPIPNSCNMLWLSLVLGSFRYRSKLSKIATGTSDTMKNITKSDVLSLPISCPPLPEQKTIADLLSTWDKAIEKTERLIAAKEMSLEAYGRELFDRNNDGKRNGWKVVKLKTVFTEHGDSSTGKEEVFSVSVHKGLVNQVEHLGRSFSAENTDHYNRVHYGDVVYTKSPTGDFPLGIVKQSAITDDVIVSPLYGVFTPVTFELGTVVDFYFSSPSRTRNYLAPIVQKGAKNTIAITNTTFLSNTMNLPIEHEVQKMVAEFVKTAREEIRVLKDIAAKYKEQKRGLMQKLLTGEWRVKVAQ